MAELSGRCLCGAVTWLSSGPVIRKLVCHCADCQRATSSPFTAFVGLDPDTVQWDGEVNHYESSAGSYRGFCQACGARLYFRSEKWPGEIHIHAATLDDPGSYRPDAQVVMRSQAPWLEALEKCPSHHDFQAAPSDKSGGAIPTPTKQN